MKTRKYISMALHLCLATCIATAANNKIKHNAAQNLALIKGISDHFDQNLNKNTTVIKLICDYIRDVESNDLLLIPCCASLDSHTLFPGDVRIFRLSPQKKLQIVQALEKPRWPRVDIFRYRNHLSDEDHKKLTAFIKQMGRDDDFELVANEINNEHWRDWLEQDCFFEQTYNFLKLCARPAQPHCTLHHVSRALSNIIVALAHPLRIEDLLKQLQAIYQYQQEQLLLQYNIAGFERLFGKTYPRSQLLIECLKSNNSNVLLLAP